jgi:drug/metabolite transporter (DMT)-like permease
LHRAAATSSRVANATLSICLTIELALRPRANSTLTIQDSERMQKSRRAVEVTRVGDTKVHTPSWIPIAALVVVAGTLGAGHVCARLAFANDVSVLTAATLRSVCASGLLFVLLRLRRTPVWPLPQQFKPTLLLGLLIAAQTVLIQVAVALLPVTLAILVFYTYPFFTGVAASALGDDRFTPQLGASLVVAFIGLALVLGVSAAPVNVLGVVAGVGAAVAFTGALVLTPKLAPGLGAPLRTFYMLSTAAVLFIATSTATQGFALPSSTAGWNGLLGLSLLYAAGIVGLFLALPLVGAVRAAVVLNLEPVGVALIAWVTLGETLAAVQIAGAMLVVGAVVFFQLRGHR